MIDHINGTLNYCIQLMGSINMFVVYHNNNVTAYQERSNWAKAQTSNCLLAVIMS